MRAILSRMFSIEMSVLMILLLPCSFLACGGGGSQADGGESDSSSVADSSDADVQKKEKAIKVDAAEVRLGDMVIPIYADGAIRTPRSVEVRTKAGGELQEVLVRDGDRVAAGQLLAHIDAREYAISLQEARYRHIQALSQIAAEGDTVIADHDALARFSERRGVLQGELECGLLNHEQHQARLLELELSALEEGAFRQQLYEQRTGLADARLAEESARLALENTEIRAPFEGIIEGLHVVPGEFVSVGSNICSVYNNDELEAAVHVLEADLGNLEEGRPVLLAIPATGDTLHVNVDVISPHLDEGSRTCQVLIRFRNPEGRFRPGMFARAEIAGWIFSDRLQVPREAVLTRDDRPLVFKVTDDRAQWLYVDTGMENSNWIEITKVHSGGSLAAGERIVVSDHLTLAHEAKLNIRRVRPPNDRWIAEP